MQQITDTEPQTNEALLPTAFPTQTHTGNQATCLSVSRLTNSDLVLPSSHPTHLGPLKPPQSAYKLGKS